MTKAGSPPTSAVVVREMRWWDINVVRAIEDDAFPHSAWTTETFWAELARVPESRAYFVAVDDGAVVGYAGVRSIGADADIQTLAVAATHRRRGIANTLMSELFRAAQKRGSSRVFLEVRADNDAAIDLYRRCEFEVTATRTNYYGPGGDALVMRKVLG